MTNLTDLLKEAEEMAPSGKMWRSVECSGDMEVGMPPSHDVITEDNSPVCFCNNSSVEISHKNSDFIAHSRNAFPSLLALLRAQADEIKAWRTAHPNLEHANPALRDHQRTGSKIIPTVHTTNAAEQALLSAWGKKHG